MDPIIERFHRSEKRALARVITRVENQTAEGRAYLAALYPRSGRGHTVGITGSGGAGKSTLTNALAAELRTRGATVGIVAVDPSSPFSHGAVLGDRIRMQDLAMDPGVFVRSMASRGAIGGLAPAIDDVVGVMDAFGFDYVLIETVGAGQDEVEIAGSATTTVLVTTPGTGDDIQAMKAGILEIADILVVNKADLVGADALVGQLQAALALTPQGKRRPPILKTIASKADGVGPVADAIDAHRLALAESGELQTLRKENARHQILAIARAILLARIESGLSDGPLAELVDQVAERQLDPHAAAEFVAAHLTASSAAGARQATPLMAANNTGIAAFE